MSEEPYQIALEAAQEELRKLENERQKTDERIARLKESIVTLSRLVKGESVFSAALADTMGLTDLTRQVLTANGKWMNAMSVRDGLVRMGVNPATYNNLLASVHNILKRLVGGGQVETDKREGKAIYRWKAREKKKD